MIPTTGFSRFGKLSGFDTDDRWIGSESGQSSEQTGIWSERADAVVATAQDDAHVEAGHPRCDR